MTVKAFPKDLVGAAVDAEVTKLSASVSATTSTAHGASLSAALDQKQRELLAHYLNVGRLTAASILSTMT